MKPSITLLSVFASLAAALLSGCGGGTSHGIGGLLDNGSGADQTLHFGSLTTRIAGTAQPPVVSGGSGSIITGVAGALVSSMVLNQPETLLSQTKMAFASEKDGNREIYIMNADGANIKRLTNHPAQDNEPALSPDGTRIIFETNRDGNFEIYIVNSEGTGLSRLTNNAAVDLEPTWSPDGTKIAFASDRINGQYDLYVLNADGSSGNTPQRLTTHTANDRRPAWSPDGSRIAFISNRNGNDDIYVMNADGSNANNPQQLTTNTAQDRFPAWSPNSMQISFYSSRSNGGDIYLMNANDGSGQIPLTNHTALDFSSSWSPDGSKIAFSSYRSGAGDIYIMDANGSNQTLLVNHTTIDEYPSWSPATTKRLNLIGTGGKLGTEAAGFCFGQNGKAITSILTFDTPASVRANARITAMTGLGEYANYLFTISNSEKITALSYLNDVFGYPVTVIGTGGVVNIASNAILSFDSTTGQVAAVLPYSANRAAGSSSPSLTQENGVHVLRGQFLGAWDGAGKNRAPNGAAEVHFDSRTGRLLSVK